MTQQLKNMRMVRRKTRRPEGRRCRLNSLLHGRVDHRIQGYSCLHTVEMKDGGKSTVLGPGGYVLMPSKHVHQFTCPSACSAFVSSDKAFDIPYVDAQRS